MLMRQREMDERQHLRQVAQEVTQMTVLVEPGPRQRQIRGTAQHEHMMES